MNPTKPLNTTYARNFIFGVEDSLVSTVGLLSGIAIAGVSQQTIILTGLVLIFVEAVSMGVGSFLSEDTVEEAERARKSQSLQGSLIMFGSYFLAGFIPLAPYLITNRPYTFWLSILASLAALFALGASSGKLFRIRILRNGLKMLLLGGVAIAVGVIVGQVV